MSTILIPLSLMTAVGAGSPVAVDVIGDLDWTLTGSVTCSAGAQCSLAIELSNDSFATFTTEHVIAISGDGSPLNIPALRKFSLAGTSLIGTANSVLRVSVSVLNGINKSVEATFTLSY